MKKVVLCLTVFMFLFSGTLTVQAHGGEEHDDLYVAVSKIENLKKFKALIDEQGQKAFLQQHNKYTLFVPSDSAFAANTEIDVRDYIVVGQFYSYDFSKLASLTAVSGKSIPIFNNGKGTLLVNNIYIESANHEASNGTFHVLMKPF